MQFLSKRLSRVTAAVVIVLFNFNLLLSPVGYAQLIDLPPAGSMVQMTPHFNPMMVKGIKLYPDNPFKLDFIVDTGDNRLSQEQIKAEGQKLAEYFLASLTTPENEMWVNLSPYEKDRTITPTFGDTKMGQELLAEDYLLKQIMATALYPERELGKEFWAKVYAQASQEFGTTNIPVDTFNKVWIVPSKAVVYQNAQTNSVFVVESRLKVMLEQDYLAANKHKAMDQYGMTEEQFQKSMSASSVSAMSSKIIKDIVVPALEKEVNEGKNFAALRQVYQSLILASWYKKNLKDSILGQGYVDRGKTQGVDTQDKQFNEKIYKQYLTAYRKGAYNYIKEDMDPATNQVVPRKYFSGGVGMTNLAMVANEVDTPQNADLVDHDLAQISVARGLALIGLAFVAVGAVATGTAHSQVIQHNGYTEQALPAPTALAVTPGAASGTLDTLRASVGGQVGRVIGYATNPRSPVPNEITANLTGNEDLRQVLADSLNNSSIDAGGHQWLRVSPGAGVINTIGNSGVAYVVTPDNKVTRIDSNTINSKLAGVLHLPVRSGSAPPPPQNGPGIKMDQYTPPPSGIPTQRQYYMLGDVMAHAAIRPAGTITRNYVLQGEYYVISFKSRYSLDQQTAEGNQPGGPLYQALVNTLGPNLVAETEGFFNPTIHVYVPKAQFDSRHIVPTDMLATMIEAPANHPALRIQPPPAQPTFELNVYQAVTGGASKATDAEMKGLQSAISARTIVMGGNRVSSTNVDLPDGSLEVSFSASGVNLNDTYPNPWNRGVSENNSRLLNNIFGIWGQDAILAVDIVSDGFSNAKVHVFFKAGRLTWQFDQRQAAFANDLAKMGIKPIAHGVPKIKAAATPPPIPGQQIHEINLFSTPAVSDPHVAALKAVLTPGVYTIEGRQYNAFNISSNFNRANVEAWMKYLAGSGDIKIGEHKPGMWSKTKYTIYIPVGSSAKIVSHLTEPRVSDFLQGISPQAGNAWYVPTQPENNYSYGNQAMMADLPPSVRRSTVVDRDGGIDLAQVAVESKGSGIRFGFKDPSILKLLMDASGLRPKVNSVENMTVPMVNLMLGFNTPANDNQPTRQADNQPSLFKSVFLDNRFKNIRIC